MRGSEGTSVANPGQKVKMQGQGRSSVTTSKGLYHRSGLSPPPTQSRRVAQRYDACRGPLLTWGDPVGW